MYLRTEVLPEKKFIGKRLTTSISDNRTFGLWSSFMPRRNEVLNAVGSDLYSVQLYPLSYFNNFNPAIEFEKWAVREASDFDIIPPGMETLVIPSGLYAVFLHKGPASEGPKTFQYIFGTWLPQSEYEVDNRPHFEILGEKYKNNSPDSEEEIWVPIKIRG